MNIRAMEIFKSVYETKSMTKSAEMLYISQPAVSKVIQEIEIEYNKKLFIREKAKLTSTEFSHELYDQVCIILSEVSKLDTLSVKEEPSHLVSSITLAQTILPEILNETDSMLKVSVVNADQVVKMIKQGSADIGIVEGNYSDCELFIKSVGFIPLAFFKHKNNKIKLNSLEQIIAQKLLMREKGSSIRTAFDKLLERHTLSYTPFFESVNSETIMTLMKETNQSYISILPKPLIDETIFELIKIENVSLQTPIQLVYRKDKGLNKFENELITKLKEKSELPL